MPDAERDQPEQCIDAAERRREARIEEGEGEHAAQHRKAVRTRRPGGRPPRRRVIGVQQLLIRAPSQRDIRIAAIERDFVLEMMRRFEKPAAAAGGDELHATRRADVAAVMMRVAGQDQRYPRHRALGAQDVADEIVDLERLRIRVARIEPAGLRPAQNDMRIRLHGLGDGRKIIALRLVDRIVELCIDSPQPPIPCQLKREIAASLP